MLNSSMTVISNYKKIKESFNDILKRTFLVILKYFLLSALHYILSVKFFKFQGSYIIINGLLSQNLWDELVGMLITQFSSVTTFHISRVKALRYTIN